MLVLDVMMVVHLVLNYRSSKELHVRCCRSTSRQHTRRVLMVSHPYADWSHRLIVVEKEGGCGQRPTLRIVVDPLKKEVVLIGVPL